jgi:hypothetical protein
MHTILLIERLVLRTILSREKSAVIFELSHLGDMDIHANWIWTLDLGQRSMDLSARFAFRREMFMTTTKDPATGVTALLGHQQDAVSMNTKTDRARLDGNPSIDSKCTSKSMRNIPNHDITDGNGRHRKKWFINAVKPLIDDGWTIQQVRGRLEAARNPLRRQGQYSRHSGWLPVPC